MQSGGFPHFPTEVFILPFEKSLIFKYSLTQTLMDSLKKIIYDQVFKINEGDFLLHFSRLDNDEKPPLLFLWLGQGWPPACTQTARPGESSHPENASLSPVFSVSHSDNVGKEK